MRSARAHVLWRPLIGWVALVALVAASAVIGSSGARAIPVGIAGVQVAIVALLFMRLIAADGLVRLSAIAGLVWASFLFLFTFADVLTR